ncbi:ribonucleoside-diphosphate reductase [Escherichia coli]|nr:ribonucleoside-diphosphate reductase [Escherichia coli]
MNQNLLVTKRDGSTERINLDKIHRVLDWAAEGLHNVSISQVELRSHIQFYDGIKTSDIHETIIKAAADLISRDAPDYQYLARAWRSSTCVKKPTASLSRLRCTTTW